MNTCPRLYAYVHAGIPAPAGEDGELFDLVSHLIRRPKDTMFVKVSGDSMIDAGIQDGDILVVDRAAEPRHRDIVVAQDESGYMVKTYNPHGLQLVPANPEHLPIPITENTRICGVATFAIHKL